MAWIESHEELRDHPKIKRLARRLQISVPEAIGNMHCLWWWAVNYAPDGDLSDYESWEIADAAMYSGDDPDAFRDALVAVGFVDAGEGGVVLHDWEDYGAKTVQRREASAKRQRRFKEKNAKTPAETADDGDGKDGNALVTQNKRVSNALVTRYPTVSNALVTPLQDRTGHDIYKYIETTPRECGDKLGDRARARNKREAPSPCRQDERVADAGGQTDAKTDGKTDGKKKDEPEKRNFREFVRLTDLEHAKLLDRFGIEATERMLDILDAYKGQSKKNQNKYDSDYRAILNWVATRYKEERAAAARGAPTKQPDYTDAKRYAGGGWDSAAATSKKEATT